MTISFPRFIGSLSSKHSETELVTDPEVMDRGSLVLYIAILAVFPKPTGKVLKVYYVSKR